MGKSPRRPPWKRSNPRKKIGRPAKKLSPSQKAQARKRAQQAGRKYPNLVDNMRVAAKAKGRARR
jgi:hypothetical protein